MGAAPAFIGGRDNVSADSGLGVRVRPGDTKTFQTKSGMYAVALPGTNYVLEVIEE